MTRKEFLDALSFKLSGLSVDEKNSALRYYEEYFEECENDEEAIASLGSPEACAEQILSENGKSMAKTAGGFVYSANQGAESDARKERNKKSSERVIIMILIAILTFPLWIAAISVVFALVVSFVAINFALVVSAIACFVGGIIKLFTSLAGAGVLIGVSFVSIGLTGLITIPLAIGFGKLIFKLARKVKQGLSNFLLGN